MRKVLLIAPGILLLLSLFSGCVDAMMIERSEHFISNKPVNPKIICIDPRFYFLKDEENFDLSKSQQLTDRIKKDIVTSARKNHIELSLMTMDEGATVGYYSDLLNLKRNMLTVNFDQRTPLNFSHFPGYGKMQKNVFIYPPRLSPEFAELSKEYGTQYYSYLGIYAGRGRLILYHVVVDADNAETIYREFKQVNKGINKAVISQMIYDSYAMLRKELK